MVFFLKSGECAYSWVSQQAVCFLIYVRNILIYAISCVHLLFDLCQEHTIYAISCVRLAVLCGKSLNVGHNAQTFQPDLFIPATRRGTIDLHHFIPLSVALTLAGFRRFILNKTSWLHFLTHFSTDQDENIM